MENENEDPPMHPKQSAKDTAGSLLRTLFSMAIFIAADYMIFKSWLAVILLVSVIFIHELGHFIAMKLFGYRGINMTFIPFVGAYVSGEAADADKRKKVIMLFAGPVPGIIIGLVLFYLYQYNHHQQYWWAAISFLLLNIFNLLPVSPLDGGQIFETVFFSGNRIIQLIFLYTSIVVLVYLAIDFKMWLLLLVAVMIFFRALALNTRYRVRKKLDENNIDYHCHFDDLTDEQYWQIRDVLVTENKLLGKKYIPGEHSDQETNLIDQVKNILSPYYEKELSKTQKIIFLLVWITAICLPVVFWIIYYGHF